MVDKEVKHIVKYGHQSRVACREINSIAYRERPRAYYWFVVISIFKLVIFMIRMDRGGGGEVGVFVNERVRFGDFEATINSRRHWDCVCL